MWLIDFLAPVHCVFCGTAANTGERSICVACYQDLPWTNFAVLPRRGVFVAAISMLRYEFPVAAAIKAMKFNRKLFYVPAFADVLCAAIPLLPADIDAVLPVPLHWRRKAARGFNQASEIAKPLARRLNVPIARNVRRKKATLFQSGLGASERTKNLRDAFVVEKTLPYQHLLLVDDVLTTGTTLTQLAKIVSRNGVESVSALTIARAD